MFSSPEEAAQSLIAGNNIKIVNQGTEFHGWKCKFDLNCKDRFVCSNNEEVWTLMEAIWGQYEYMVIE